MRYQRRNGRERRKNSNEAGNDEKRTYKTLKKKQNPLVIAGIAGGAFLVLIIIIIAAYSSPAGDTDSAGKEPGADIQEEIGKIKELVDSGGADKDEADRLAREDDQKLADRYYRSAYDKFDRALAMVKPLDERFPDTEFARLEQEIEQQLADIKSKAGFNIGE
jgi:hypothetical protein